MRAASQLIQRAWREFGGLTPPPNLPVTTAPVPLLSRLAVSELAIASITTAAYACRMSPEAIARIAPAQIAAAYQSDRYLRIAGITPSVWGDGSGFWRTRDGWIRTHANYPHHARALFRGLGLAQPVDRNQLATLFAELTEAEAVAAITATGGFAVPVKPEDPATDTSLRDSPLVDVGRHDASGRFTSTSLAGARVLDLTRVIAGPVCTRTLALFGADVLRIDPPDLPEPEWQHFDTGHGKRTSLLRADAPEFTELLARADVVVIGYRPQSLERFGLTPEALIERFPGLVVVQLSAWGMDQPGRAGFDSLVQAESGIAWIESADGVRPGALPAQALDHSAGYLLAAATAVALQRARIEGGSWIIRSSLRRIAAELLGMPRSASPLPSADSGSGREPALASFAIDGLDVVTVESPFPGHRFQNPRRWGADPARW